MISEQKKESGAIYVEAALLLPILAMILFGIVQYGFVLNAYVTLRNASSEVARAYALDYAVDYQSVAEEAIQPTLTAANLTFSMVNHISSGGDDGQLITLTYAYPITLKFVMPWVAGNTLPLTVQTFAPEPPV